VQLLLFPYFHYSSRGGERVPLKNDVNPRGVLKDNKYHRYHTVHPPYYTTLPLSHQHVGSEVGEEEEEQLLDIIPHTSDRHYDSFAVVYK